MWRPPQLIASVSGMTTPTTCVRHRDDLHPLCTSRRLCGVMPTSHEAPADDSTPLTPTMKCKSPDLHEEGICKRLRTRYLAENEAVQVFSRWRKPKRRWSGVSRRSRKGVYSMKALGRRAYWYFSSCVLMGIHTGACKLAILSNFGPFPAKVANLHCAL
ncbi:hypothetical protein DFH09DRAFT_1087958 [Mycena vulgaris]|nr:hypothetical protein DFH09DRAFT_1087958 [Mycena vulgaris]